MTKQNAQGHTNPFNIIVIVAALGYFVDVYDLLLFSIVRVPSLKEIGIPEDQIKDAGIYLLNVQLIGLLLGGVVWGILGDKKGRMSTLFFTILLYSIANIANGFVQNLDQYAILRLIAGFGLAGELGVSITLVSEVMTKETRGWGTAVVSFIGILGAVLAFYVAKWGWKQAYWTGGTLGLCLLILRVYVHESGMFDKVKSSSAKRGDFLSIFSNGKRLLKYVSCIFIGVPAWFAIGILITFSNDFAKVVGVTGPINPAETIMYHYAGASIGSVIISFISQRLKSRKKALIIAIISLSFLTTWYFYADGASPACFYFIAFVLGLAMGYWSIFITVASEQFGTNIRSTVTTTIPNFVRASTVLMTLWWRQMSISMSIIQAAVIVAAVVFPLALAGIFLLKETYGKDLDYVEES